jgi:hypothetical protein
VAICKAHIAARAINIVWQQQTEAVAVDFCVYARGTHIFTAISKCITEMISYRRYLKEDVESVIILCEDIRFLSFVYDHIPSDEFSISMQLM